MFRVIFVCSPRTQSPVLRADVPALAPPRQAPPFRGTMSFISRGEVAYVLSLLHSRLTPPHRGRPDARPVLPPSPHPRGHPSRVPAGAVCAAVAQIHECACIFESPISLTRHSTAFFPPCFASCLITRPGHRSAAFVRGFPTGLVTVVEGTDGRRPIGGRCTGHGWDVCGRLSLCPAQERVTVQNVTVGDGAATAAFPLYSGDRPANS